MGFNSEARLDAFSRARRHDYKMAQLSPQQVLRAQSRHPAVDFGLHMPAGGILTHKAEVIHLRSPWQAKQTVRLASLKWVALFSHHQ